MFALLFVSFPVVEAVLPRLHSINRDIADAVVEPFDNLNWKHFRREGGMRRAQADITVRTRCARTCLPTRRSCLSCAFILSFFFFYTKSQDSQNSWSRVSSGHHRPRRSLRALSLHLDTPARSSARGERASHDRNPQNARVYRTVWVLRSFESIRINLVIIARCVYTYIYRH